MNLNKSKISVIMANYNGESFLNDAIKSVLKQTYKDFSFIIVDDCSNDNSLNIINKFAKNDNRIKVIKNKVNMGQQASLNIAINDAIYENKSEFIAHMDSDDYVENKWLERQISYIKKNNVDVAGVSNTHIVDENNNLLFKVVNPTDPFEILLRMYVEGMLLFTHTGTVYKASVFKKVAGYNTDYLKELEDFSKITPYAGDTNLMFCFALNNFKLANNKIGTVYYRKHKSQVTSSLKKHNDSKRCEYEAVRNFMKNILGKNVTSKESELLRSESYDPFYYIIWDVAELNIKKTYNTKKLLLKTFELKREMLIAFLSKEGDTFLNRLKAVKILGKSLKNFLSHELDEITPYSTRMLWLIRWFGNILFPKIIPPLGKN